MTDKIAYIFPGQGSQFVGMGKCFYDNFDVSKEVYEFANNLLNKDISSLCFNGDEDELKSTINSQPCIVTTEIAILSAFQQESNITPCAVAGHSLGEYSALYCAKALNMEGTLIAIQNRALAMSKVSDGKMCAVISDDIKTIQDILNSVIGVATIANYNSPKQVVISGESSAIDNAVIELNNAGIKKVIPLAVSGAFHSPLMKNVAKEYGNFLSTLQIIDAKIPVYTNVDATPESNSENIRLKMEKQIYSSVLWTQTVQNMANDGIDTFIEIGPENVLSGLVKRTLNNVRIFNINDMNSFEYTLKNLFIRR